MLPDYYINNYAYTVPFEGNALPTNFNLDDLLESVLNQNIKWLVRFALQLQMKIYYLIFNDYF
jgi:hypothetical protein